MRLIPFLNCVTLSCIITMSYLHVHRNYIQDSAPKQSELQVAQKKAHNVYNGGPSIRATRFTINLTGSMLDQAAPIISHDTSTWTDRSICERYEGDTPGTSCVALQFVADYTGLLSSETPIPSVTYSFDSDLHDGDPAIYHQELNPTAFHHGHIVFLSGKDPDEDAAADIKFYPLTRADNIGHTVFTKTLHEAFSERNFGVSVRR